MAENNTYTFSLPTTINGTINVEIAEGKPLFVLGANGTGKSALMYHAYMQNKDNSLRITPHRQNSFRNNISSLSSQDRKTLGNDHKSYDTALNSRYHDPNADQKPRIALYDLINSQNKRSRTIADAIDDKNIKLALGLSEVQAPLPAINELLKLANLQISLSLESDESLMASKNGSPKYGISELSDGERNVLLICASVLTAEPKTVIIIDEPERHLHRSIISPLLTALFGKRQDCVFIISTHDISLPLDHINGNILLIRNCSWADKNVSSWDVDLIPASDNIPMAIKKEILGGQRKFLFVEGVINSLDYQIYQLIFPEVTVIPQGNSVQVERAVYGLAETEKLHWVKSFGLIDSDDRTSEQIQKLQSRGVAALPCYSVESLYYHLDIIKKIAFSLYDETTREEIFKNATSKIKENLLKEKERLCSRLCEKKIREQIMKSFPNHQSIIKDEFFELKINMKELFDRELSHFQKLIDAGDLNSLLFRYPVRETQVLTDIVRGLKINREDYEKSVRSLLVNESSIIEFYQKLLKPITELVYN